MPENFEWIVLAFFTGGFLGCYLTARAIQHSYAQLFDRLYAILERHLVERSLDDDWWKKGGEG